MAAVVSVPLVVWAVGWIAQGWLPQGDEAIIALKARDVFSAHPPLLGMRSTSGLSVPGASAHHPGPLEFYLLAIPYLVSGWRSAGLVVGCLVLAIGFVTVALWHGWVAGRERGLGVVLASILGAELIIGPSLVLPWNPWPPVLGLLAVMVLAWRLFLGHVRVLPWFTAITSFVVQANLTFVALLLPLLGVLAGVGIVRWHRRHGAWWPLSREIGAGDTPVWRRTGVLASALLILCWLPSLVELWLIHPNNASQIWALGMGTHGPAAVVGALIVLLIAVWVGRSVLRRRRVPVRWAIRRTAGLMALGALLAIAAGGSGRLLYLIMAITVPFFVMGAIGYRRLRFRVPRRGNLAAIGAALAVAGAVVAPGAPGSMFITPRESSDVDRARAVVGSATAALRADGLRGGPVIVDADGGRSYSSYQTAIVIALRNDGYTPYYDSPWPHPEDDAFRRTVHAPRTAPILRLHDGRAPWVVRR
ncbi:hypothetical protein [Allobranchiibius sp. GilTou73]|uniref:hypothetical protein n=1 Tax=Allobranchiibius sp. GilTou73 TaxID=2904523 RepID=UPI001F33984A|nr:hypothetical protein [Allobranchiibius sp. GilTou73]UIJ33822.1 hypothetical protein LVQ62_11750 [Allobranchiibius sp. GilTou73]